MVESYSCKEGLMCYQNRFHDCYVSFEDNILKIGNERIERTWLLTGKLPQVSTLKNKKTGKQWLAEETRGQLEVCPERKAGFFRQGITVGEMKLLDITAKCDNDLGIAEEFLQIELHLSFGERRVDWVHRIYPQTAAMKSFFRAGYAQIRISEEYPEEWIQDYCDYLPLDTEHSSWKSVALTDVTDDNDNLVIETRGILTHREARRFCGNLLFIKEKGSADGVLLLKEGPSVVGYLTQTKEDFAANGMDLLTVGWGFDAQDLQPGEMLESYGSIIILWDGNEEDALKALHQYNRAVRKFKPGRDALIMSNTWGDGNADGRISESFLMKELRAARELGIHYFQIDDGWQNGTTANSVNAAKQGSAVWGSGFYQADADFWAVNKQRLPNGLAPLVEYAEKNGIRLGLWFSPDAQNDYENWEKDAQTILGLYQKYGITAFKMDGLTFHNKRGEENFGRLMRSVVEGSNGEVFFNLDTTASVRNGYFGRVQYGCLFLENRFTKPFGKWPNYWPHHTLRNLWMLSRYLPAERLQIEFLNVSKNIDAYKNDPLSPSVWGQELVFAISMFACPLAWMEVSALDEHAKQTLRDAIAKYRIVQPDILGAHVLPIGDEPDGYSWTGFQSVKEDGSGYLMVLRERSEKDSYRCRLWGIRDCEVRLEPILGSGQQKNVTVDFDGYTDFFLDKPFSYALYRYSPENKSMCMNREPQ